MVQLLGVIQLMAHCGAVYAVVAVAAVTDDGRQFAVDVHPVSHDHLEPELLPAYVADG